MVFKRRNIIGLKEYFESESNNLCAVNLVNSSQQGCKSCYFGFLVLLGFLKKSQKFWIFRFFNFFINIIKYKPNCSQFT